MKLGANYKIPYNLLLSSVSSGIGFKNQRLKPVLSTDLNDIYHVDLRPKVSEWLKTNASPLDLVVNQAVFSKNRVSATIDENKGHLEVNSDKKVQQEEEAPKNLTASLRFFQKHYDVLQTVQKYFFPFYAPLAWGLATHEPLIQKSLFHNNYFTLYVLNYYISRVQGRKGRELVYACMAMTSVFSLVQNIGGVSIWQRPEDILKAGAATALFGLGLKIYSTLEKKSDEAKISMQENEQDMYKFADVVDNKLLFSDAVKANEFHEKEFSNLYENLMGYPEMKEFLGVNFETQDELASYFSGVQIGQHSDTQYGPGFYSPFDRIISYKGKRKECLEHEMIHALHHMAIYHQMNRERALQIFELVVEDREEVKKVEKFYNELQAGEKLTDEMKLLAATYYYNDYVPTVDREALASFFEKKTLTLLPKIYRSFLYAIFTISYPVLRFGFKKPLNRFSFMFGYNNRRMVLKMFKEGLFHPLEEAYKTL